MIYYEKIHYTPHPLYPLEDPTTLNSNKFTKYSFSFRSISFWQTATHKRSVVFVKQCY